MDIEGLQSFPFELSMRPAGDPLLPEDGIVCVAAYESGVDGLVIISGASVRNTHSGVAWIVVHGPTGCGLLGTQSFPSALALAAEIKNEFGDAILATTDAADAVRTFRSWIDTKRGTYP